MFDTGARGKRPRYAFFPSSRGKRKERLSTRISWKRKGSHEIAAFRSSGASIFHAVEAE